MGDSYTEQLVKQKASSTMMLKKIGLIIAIIICAFIAMAIPIPVFMVLPAFGILGLFYLWRRWSSVEYEYLYFNGDLDIDRIMGQEARKRLISISAKGMEVLAPTGSPELRPYQDLKVYDCSSKMGNKTYEIVAKLKDQNVRVIFEPNDTILQGMRAYAPRKVFL